jgi:hypothetical protein
MAAMQGAWPAVARRRAWARAKASVRDASAAGPACRARPETGRRPAKAFSFSNLIFRNSKPFQIRILKKKNAFSRFDPKIEVVQNLILYNFALGHILKFQTDFELKIQSLFFK